MSGGQPMPSARRRPIRGMASERVHASSPATVETDEAERVGAVDEVGAAIRAVADAAAAPVDPLGDNASKGPRQRARARVPSADYTSTRLVNFRIPVDLHDRFRALVREVEVDYPRVRRPSLTELIIALLEEGPQSADEVAELIRRKRASEHAER